MIETFAAIAEKQDGGQVKGNLCRLPSFADGVAASVTNEEEYDFHPFAGNSVQLLAGEMVTVNGLTLEVVWVLSGVPGFEQVRLRRRWNQTS